MQARTFFLLRRAWFVVLVLCASAVAASEPETSVAPDYPDEHELEVFVGGRLGYLEVDDVDEGSPTVGFIYGLQPHRHLTFTGTVDYHSANFSNEERRTFALTAGLEVYPLSYWYPVRPYALGGVGVYISEVRRFNDFGDVLFDDTESDSGYHAGVGLDIDCCQLEEGTEVIINLESRWMFTQEDKGTDEVRPDGVQYTVGVKFQF